MLGTTNSGGIGVLPGDVLFGGDFGKEPTMISKQPYTKSALEVLATNNLMWIVGETPEYLVNIDTFEYVDIKKQKGKGQNSRGFPSNDKQVWYVSSSKKGGYGNDIPQSDLESNRFYLELYNLKTGEKLKELEIAPNLNMKFFRGITGFYYDNKDLYIIANYNNNYYEEAGYTHIIKVDINGNIIYVKSLPKPEDTVFYIDSKYIYTTTQTGNIKYDLNFNIVGNFNPEIIYEPPKIDGVLTPLKEIDGQFRDYYTRYVDKNEKMVWDIKKLVIDVGGNANNYVKYAKLNNDMKLFILIRSSVYNNYVDMYQLDFQNYLMPEFDITPWWMR